MKNKLISIIGIFMIAILIMSIPCYAAQFSGGVGSSFSGNYQVVGSSSNPQFNQPSFSYGSSFDPRTLWANYNKEDCNERQDILLMIPPGGCSPSVVRSDLLEEQNVPVFCKVTSIKMNPLIDISKIKSIRFTGDKPKGVQSISYFPARAAVNSIKTIESGPITDNIGYLVVVLKGGTPEKDLPEFLEGNVTAVIDYDAEGTFGVGQQSFFLNEFTEGDWINNYKSSGFWKGKGYLRASEIQDESAVISVYQDAERKLTSVKLDEGETSNTINLGGYYCSAGMKLRLEDVTTPRDMVLLRVDDQEMYLGEGSKFLDGKCSVKDIEIFDAGGGSVDIRCSGSKSFELKLDPLPAVLEVDGGENRAYKQGDFIKEVDEKKVYLAYSGRAPDKDSEYAILVSSKIGESAFADINSFIHQKQESYSWARVGIGVKNVFTAGLADSKASYTEGILKDVLLNGNRELTKEELRFYGYLEEKIYKKYPELKENVRVLFYPGASWSGIALKNRKSADDALEDPILREFHEKALENYEEVFDLYPKETGDDENEAPYGARALANAGDLSRLVGLESRARGYYEKLIENYPSSALANSAEYNLQRFLQVSEDSQALVYVNEESHFISLFEIRKPGYEEMGAELLFFTEKGPVTVEWRPNSQQLIPGTKYLIEISNIDEDSVELSYDIIDPDTTQVVINTASQVIGGKKVLSKGEKLEKGKTFVFDKDLSVKLIKTHLNKQAVVKIIPEVKGTRTEGQFSFKIGIEKRAIELSPERTKKLIKNLQEQIKKWSEISAKLTKIIRSLKAACFATSAVLTIKNFFGGLGGEAKARNDLMTGKNGWNAKCQVAVNAGTEISECGGGKYDNVADCLLECNDVINVEVEKRAKRLEEENDNLKRVQSNKDVKKTEDGWFTESYNTKNIRDVYQRDVFEPFCIKNKDNDLQVNIRGESGEMGALALACKPENMKELSTVDMRDIMTEYDIQDSLSKNKISEALYDVNLKAKTRDSKEKFKEEYGDKDLPINSNIFAKTEAILDMNPVSGRGKNQEFFYLVEDRGLPDKMKDIEGQRIHVVVEPAGDGWKVVSAVKKVNNKNVDVKNSINDYFGKAKIKKSDSSLYENNELKGGKVEYYQRAPYQGLPALVPFDYKNGWYAYTDYILTGIGKPYDDSGRAINFWVCNAGKNGLMERKSVDTCTQYVAGSPGSFKFPGLSPSESSSLASRAERALREASRQYNRAKDGKSVTIEGRSYESMMAGDRTTGECENFMSPAECNLMFNVCDPVICPSSRCDYGGKYRVDDVIQSGIIGSLVLCLPNFPQVKVPVCLTGVQAGIDSLVSIFNSTEACLQESLKTGRNVGICDEIKSIYLCEFFWKQASPLLNVAIPRLFEFALGQGVRGGGEYLTVQSAWDNTQKSINYFTNQYAVNSFKAFNIRSTAELGSEVCKSFIGTRYPASADLFDKLIDPDSPVQYSGWFDESVLNSATIPPTSQYKVYYHIYAGKDAGAQYVVYLRGTIDQGLVKSTGDYVVDRGFVPLGGQVDEAKDIVAVSGFNQLCISVNGKEDCNFKQVSTDAGLNYIRDSYAAELASEKDIVSSEDCVAGKSSLLSFVQPNLQAGAEEYIEPELYKRGIVRVCSTGNPGAGVDKRGELDSTGLAAQRWREVGYCDDKNVKCWVDTNTVESVLSVNKILQDKTLTEIGKSDIEKLGEMPQKEVEAKLKGANVLRNGIKGRIEQREDMNILLKDIDEHVMNLEDVNLRSIDNKYRAKALFLKAEIYRAITETVYQRGIESKEGTAEVSKGITFKEMYEKTCKNKKNVNCPFDEFRIEGGSEKYKITQWKWGNEDKLELSNSDGEVYGTSGGLYLKVKDDWKGGKMILHIWTEHNDYFDSSLGGDVNQKGFEITYEGDGATVVLNKKGFLMIDIDEEHNFRDTENSFFYDYGEGGKQVWKYEDFDNEVFVTFGGFFKELKVKLETTETLCEYHLGDSKWICEDGDKAILEPILNGKSYDSVKSMVDESGVPKKFSKLSKEINFEFLEKEDERFKLFCDFVEKAKELKEKDGPYIENFEYVGNLYRDQCLTEEEYNNIKEKKLDMNDIIDIIVGRGVKQKSEAFKDLKVVEEEDEGLLGEITNEEPEGIPGEI